MKPSMKSRLAVAFSIGLYGLAVPAPTVPGQERAGAAQQPFTPPRAEAKGASDAARLEPIITRLMKDGDVPGLSIALVRDGELVWHQGFGVKNAKTKEPVNETTVFEAASLSKPVFAYAVLKLVDEGKLDLDKPLQHYLPGNYDVGEDPRLGQITARRVLGHTTGFPNWRPRDGALKIHFTPGERFSYSGEGFVYLAKAVEHLTGQAFNDFMKRYAFEPLRMTDSSFVWRDGYEAQKIFRHNWAGEPTGQNQPPQANAAASLHTTARDFGRFISAVLKGTGLKEATLRQMLTPQVKVREGGANTINRPEAKPSPNLSWGLGWGLQSTPDGLSFWHWGDNGDSKAYVVACDRRKLGVVVFTNSANGLSIISEVLEATVDGDQPALAWLNYESYRSPARALLKNILAHGAEAALGEYRRWRKGRAAGEVVSERQMNRLGYDLLSAKRVKDAVAVFKLNVEDYPQSFNTYDSLAEAYLADGDKDLAIKNYQRAAELNPDNARRTEVLKKLREGK